MSIAGGIVVYIIIWWMVLFMLLPVGVQAQHESDDVMEPGTAPSAPVAPRLIRKMLITSGIAAVLWAGVFVTITFELLTLDDFPF